MGAESQYLSFVSRSHFELSSVLGERDWFKVVNLSCNPLAVGQEHLGKGEHTLFRAPGNIDFIPVAGFPQDTEPQLYLRLRLMPALPRAAQGQPERPAQPPAENLAATCEPPSFADSVVEKGEEERKPKSGLPSPPPPVVEWEWSPRSSRVQPLRRQEKGDEAKDEDEEEDGREQEEDSEDDVEEEVEEEEEQHQQRQFESLPPTLLSQASRPDERGDQQEHRS
jgi:hypothetical protein